MTNDVTKAKVTEIRIVYSQSKIGFEKIRNCAVRGTSVDTYGSSTRSVSCKGGTGREVSMLVDGNKDGVVGGAGSGCSALKPARQSSFSMADYRRRQQQQSPRWYVPLTCSSRRSSRRHTINTSTTSPMSCSSSAEEDVPFKSETVKPSPKNSPISRKPSSSSCYKNKNYTEEIFSQLDQLRKDGILCDVVLKVSSHVSNAHRVVLAAFSPYFRAMFTNEMLEKNQSSITLQDIDHEALSLLVDYAYCGEILITEENVQVILPAASLLQVAEIQEACCGFLVKQLHPTNCLGIKKFADAHACLSLHHSAQCFALKHFAAVTETEEFLDLSCNEIVHLITCDCLNVSSEDEVYKAVMRWIKHDFDNRGDHLTKLLNCVRFPLMSKNSLMQIVQTEPLLRSNHNCKDLLIEAMAYHLSPDRRRHYKSVRTSERMLKNSKPYLFVIGGSSVFSIQEDCECYDPRIDKWARVPPMLIRRTRVGIASTNRKLFVLGGYDGIKDLSSVETYDPVKNKWSALVPMVTKRSSLGACSMNGLVYASGGYDGSACLESVERYDPLADNWTSIQVMNTKRRYHKLVALDGFLYAIGGFDGTSYLSAVEKFDPELGKWENVMNMSYRRSGAGVCTHDGKIYVTGGTDGGVSLSSGECYYPEKNIWKPIASMLSRRGTHELVDVDDFMYAIGGNDGTISLNTIEKYDPVTNSWKMERPMTSRRSSVGATIFKCDAHIEKIFISKKLKIQSDI